MTHSGTDCHSQNAGPAGADVTGVARADALPSMVKIRQPVRGNALENPAAMTQRSLARLDLGPLNGARVAIAVGSRGITDIVPVTAACVAHLRNLGADPFIVPGMGSHGGATETGQRDVLAALGVTEDSVGCPIVCDIQSLPVAQTMGNDTLMLRAAAEADGVVAVNRIKPHTDFSGSIESGLAKMLAVGLGGPDGAVRQHRLAAAGHGMQAVVVAAARALVNTGRILAGIGIVENSAHRTGIVEAVGPKQLLDREAALLATAKQWSSRLPVPEVDVLIVERFGKDISGAGMDTKVTGRHSVPYEPPFTSPRVRYIIVGELTEASHGNAAGIGNADFITRDLYQQIDWSVTYRNSLTSGCPASSACPIVVPSLEDGLRIAVGCLGLPDPTQAKVVRIRDTLSLEEVEVSTALLDMCHEGAEPL